MSTAFVTGASGFIGGALTKRLVAEGWTRERAGAQREERQGRASARRDAVQGDLDDVTAMTEGARGCDVAFHCAAHLGEWGNAADFERVQRHGHRQRCPGGAARPACRVSSTSAPRPR